jgi:hypothetical protein
MKPRSKTMKQDEDLMKPSTASETTPPPRTAAELDEQLRQHPMRRKTYKCVTPVLTRTMQIVTHAVLYRWRSCVFVGPSRVGKTYAKEYVANRLRESFPDIYLIEYSCNTWSKPSVDKFCISLFQEDGPTSHDPDMGQTQDARIALARNWHARAMSKGADHLVLVLDEFGNLKAHELQCLAEILNACHELHLRSTVIAFGTWTLLPLKNSLLASGKDYLVARFLSILIRYEGVESLDDVEAVMHGYDDALLAEYPPKSGWSFARFFFPANWQGGWRLRNEAERLWNAFGDVVAPAKKKERLSICMESVTSAIETALIDNRSIEFVPTPFDHDDWAYAVAKAHFVDSLGYSYIRSKEVRSTAEALSDFGIELDSDEAKVNRDVA